MPTFDSSWLDQHQCFPPPGPQPPQKQPKHAVSWLQAPLPTSEDAELVAQGKSLEQEISTRCPSRSVRSPRPDDGSHRLVECRPATPTSMIFGPAQYWRGTGCCGIVASRRWSCLANLTPHPRQLSSTIHCKRGPSVSATTSTDEDLCHFPLRSSARILHRPRAAASLTLHARTREEQ